MASVGKKDVMVAAQRREDKMRKESDRRRSVGVPGIYSLVGQQERWGTRVADMSANRLGPRVRAYARYHISPLYDTIVSYIE
jgi:hypothetical protein